MNAEQVANGARALGLHQVPAALLASLVADGPASQAALTVRLGVAPSTVCRAVRVLDDMGLVETLPLRRNAVVRPVPFDTSLPALTERHRQQMARALDRLIEACALLGVPIEQVTEGAPAGSSIQPVPVGSCEPPYIVPQTGFAGGELHWELTMARRRRDAVLSAQGSGVQAPGARQLMLGGPGRVTVRAVVTSCELMDQVWRKRLREYIAAGIDVRTTPARSAPFMIIDEQRVGLNVLVIGTVGGRRRGPSRYAPRVSDHYVDSEVGRLRTVLLHRPGPELKRLTPRNNDALLFDGIPWVGRAQEEHDSFAAALRDHDVEVLYLAELLTETLQVAAARTETIAGVAADPRLGATLRRTVTAHLSGLHPEDLADVLIAGLAHEETSDQHSLTYRLMETVDFVIDPLPNLLFTRDSSVWVRDRVAVTSPSMPARQRETTLTQAIYRHHPRFAGTPTLYSAGQEWLEGGDVLLLTPGVLAIGVGQRTTSAGVEALARRVFGTGVAHTVLVVPISQERATMHLDTVCTMVDVDAVLMYPAVADTLVAYTMTNGEQRAVVTGPEPFLVAAAKAMGIDTLRMIDTGLDPVTAEREQWDDGNNTLCVAPRLAVAYERNVETNEQLEQAGIEVIRIAGSELGSGRGGPRCMSCPILRDSLP